MGHIFISYSRRDTETVDHIVDLMRKTGLEVWLDRHDIRAGNQWRVQIVQAIDTCDAFVLMLSPNSATSENVRKEIDLAQDSGRTTFVVMLEPVKIPSEIRYQLAGLQFIEVQRLGLDQAVRSLNDTLKDHLSTLRPTEVSKGQQVELVIQGINLNAFGEEKRQQLLDFIAQLTNSSQSGLSIAGMAAGSVHVFVDMPIEIAYQLKTFALNRDKRFKRFGIASLRLAGDKKYVNIALGVLTAAATIGLFQAIWLGMPSLLMPVVGATAGKVLTISVIVGVSAGVAVSAPKVITPLFLPASTPTQTFTAIPDSALSILPLPRQEQTSAPEEVPDDTSTLPEPATNTPDLTLIPSITATPQDPLVLVDTACFREPRVNDRVISHLDKGSRVKVVARSDDGMWWLVENPVYFSLCWVQKKDLQIDPGVHIIDIPIFYIFSQPTSDNGTDTPQCTSSTPVSVDRDCYCKWHSWDSTSCMYYP